MSGDSHLLYFQDLAVGDRFQSPELTVSVAELKDFAARYDPQPFHLDEAAALDSLFGALVLSGWHTTAVTMRLMVDSTMRLAGGIIGGGVSEIRWPRPTRPGERLKAEMEVVELIAPGPLSRSGRGRARVQVTTRGDGGDVVLSMIANLFVPLRADSPAGDPGGDAMSDPAPDPAPGPTPDPAPGPTPPPIAGPAAPSAPVLAAPPGASPWPLPPPAVLRGQHVTLQPVHPERDAAALWQTLATHDPEGRVWRFLGRLPDDAATIDSLGAVLQAMASPWRTSCGGSTPMERAVPWASPP